MGLSRWLRNQWDRAAAIVSAMAGGMALLLGWLGVSRVSLPAEQIPYLASGAMFGLFALALGATLWLSADLRDEWRKLDDIYHSIEREDKQRPEELEGLDIAPEAGSGQPDDLARPDARVPARRSRAVSRT